MENKKCYLFKNINGDEYISLKKPEIHSGYWSNGWEGGGFGCPVLNAKHLPNNYVFDKWGITIVNDTIVELDIEEYHKLFTNKHRWEL